MRRSSQLRPLMCARRRRLHVDPVVLVSACQVPPSALAALPLMALGTWTGSKLNERAGERAFAALFWTVMGGYSIRLGILLL